MSISIKPDVVITDREAKQKCSIEPLRGRSDLVFFASENLSSIPTTTLDGCIFLHVDGPPLFPEDVGKPLLLLDASWKRALKIAQSPMFSKLEKRSLTGFETSYPRKSRLYTMPHGGLASVEALFAARLIQGRESLDLFDFYHWKVEFLERNQQEILDFQAFWQEKKDIRKI